jgi:hypothetical protein
MVGLGSAVGVKVGLGIPVDVDGGSVKVGKTVCIDAGVGPYEQDAKYSAMKSGAIFFDFMFYPQRSLPIVWRFIFSYWERIP